MRSVLPRRRERGVYTVTDARRSKSEDISYRQRRYLISMGVRVVAFLLAVFLFHGVWRFVAAAIALVVPYFAVVFANGGREPDNSAVFEPYEPNLPQRAGADGEPPAADAATREGAAADPGSPGDARTADGARADTAADDTVLKNITSNNTTSDNITSSTAHTSTAHTSTTRGSGHA